MNLDSPRAAGDSFSAGNCSAALVLGAGHGIGLSTVEALLRMNNSIRIIATYRDNSRAHGLLRLQNQFSAQLEVHALDPLTGDLNVFCSQHLDKSVPLDLVLNCIGVLHCGNMQPERSLGEITLPQMQRAFAVNSCITPLLAQACKPFIARKKPAVFAALSALVGSIGDNRLGGWYSYRASKAALNMFIKTIAIEMRNARFAQLSVLAIHPGTTETDLSRPFLRGIRHPVLQPEQTAENILRACERGYQSGTGLFLNWDGEIFPW